MRQKKILPLLIIVLLVSCKNDKRSLASEIDQYCNLEESNYGSIIDVSENPKLNNEEKFKIIRSEMIHYQAKESSFLLCGRCREINPKKWSDMSEKYFFLSARLSKKLKTVTNEASIKDKYIGELKEIIFDMHQLMIEIGDAPLLE